MSITLESKLTSIPSNEIIPELSALVDKAHAKISWSGNRVVSVNGYNGEVEIDALARKYLQASFFDRDSSACTPLAEVLGYYSLWKRIQDLYEDSEKELSNTRFYKHAISSLPPGPNRLARVRGLRSIMASEFSRISLPIEFTQTEFMAVWPNSIPLEVTEPDSSMWYLVGKEKVAKVMRRCLL
jgi:hypothetical protein